MSSDALDRHLHGRSIDCSGASWQIDVYSIVDSAADRWIQIGLNGTSHRTVLLKLAHFADDTDAVNALKHWVGESPWPHGGVLSVSASTEAHPIVSASKFMDADA